MTSARISRGSGRLLLGPPKIRKTEQCFAMLSNDATKTCGNKHVLYSEERVEKNYCHL